MRSRRLDTLLGTLVVTAVLLAGAAVLWLRAARGDGGAVVHSDFSRVDGLAPDAPVRLRGLTVGRVAAVEPRRVADGTLAFRVSMRLRASLLAGPDPVLHASTVARLVPGALDGIGGGAVELEPSTRAGAPLRDGAVLPGVLATSTAAALGAVADRVSSKLTASLVASDRLIDSLQLASRAIADAAARAASLLSATERLLPVASDQALGSLRRADSVIAEFRSVPAATVAALDSARALMSETRGLLVRVDSLVAGGEPIVLRSLANLDSGAAVLKHFTREVSRRPIRAITGVRPPSDLPQHPRPD